MTAIERPPGALAGTPLDDVSAGLDLCVHCGFCLQACPTYIALEDENDSPRGRLMLMRAANEGSLALDDASFHRHIDLCLGCRACETACPSGVPYGRLLEATRETLAPRRPLGRLTATMLIAMANETLRRVVLGGGRLLRTLRLTSLLAKLPGRVGFAMAMLESTRPVFPPSRATVTSDGRRGSAALLTGCVMEQLFSHTNQATARVLARNGYRMVEAAGQRCCGALHAHAGEGARAKSLARANIGAFERSGADFIVANAAGCGAMMKEYGHLLRHDPDWSERAARFGARVRDVSELLADAGPADGGGLQVRVTADAPCHLVHAQRVADPPLAVLRAIRGLSFTPLSDADHCCGGAGIYNLVQPASANSILREKVARIRETGAEVIATGNPGCHMQIGAGLLRAGVPARCAHPVDLLDRAYGTSPTA